MTSENGEENHEAEVLEVHPSLPQDFTLAMAKKRYDCSKAKALIYGEEESHPSTPDLRGTKSMNLQPHETPFATFNPSPEDVYPIAYVKRQSLGDMSDKIGKRKDFDPKIYMKNRENNFRNQRESRMRNFSGSGKILAHECK